MKVLSRTMFVLILASGLFAQQPAKSNAEQPVKAEESRPPDNFYKLAFVIYELEGGKRVNQRDYSVIAKANVNPSPSVRISTRIPIYTEETKMQYVDAGLRLNCNVIDQASGKIQVHCEVDISGFVQRDQVPESRGNAVVPAPVLRSTNSSTWALLTPGKSSVIASIDDINSAKRMQIEVTATKVE